MDVSVHNPERKQCETMECESGVFAIIGFECQYGGITNLFFTAPDELRQHATAMNLLAEKLEEEQSK